MAAQIKVVEVPKSHWFWGSLQEFRANGLNFLLAAALRGDIARYRFGPFKVLVLNSPEALHDVLVTNAAKFNKSKLTKQATAPLLGFGLFTNDGDFWKSQRKLVSPAFHTRRIASYADIMVRFARQKADQWASGTELDIEAEMSEITMHIISKAGFDFDMEGGEMELSKAVHDVLEVVNRQLERLMPVPYWFPSSEIRKFNAANNRLQTLIQDIIDRRRSGKSGQDIDDKGDALSMLLMARDDEGNPMPDKQIRDELMTLFGAGHETTAKALTWALYIQSQHPDIAEKLRAELDSVLGERPPTLDDLPRLRYLDQFVKEVLRLYPPAWVTTREPIADTTILGEPVAKDTPVILNIYGSHRNPAFFANPEKFDPERWTEDFEKSLPKSTYLPFGNGPRICIGASFASMEAKLVLAVLLQKFTFALRANHPVEPQNMFTLRPKYGMPMTVTTR